MTIKARLFLAAAVSALWTAASDAGAPPGYLNSRGVCNIDSPPGFTRAEPAEKSTISYPSLALNDWGEGWVLAEFTVTIDGRVRDLAVVDAIGAKDFVASTTSAIAAQRFKPAQRNGAPVEQHLRNTFVSYLFEDTAATVTHPEFPERYQIARNRILSNRFDEAIEQLERMMKVWRLNLYELSMTSYLLAFAHAKKEDWENARYHIEHAVTHDGTYLNEGLKSDAMELLVKLRARATDTAGALCALNFVSAEKRAGLAPLESELRSRLLSDAPMVSDGKLIKHPLADQPGTWRRQLQRRKFSFANIGGDVKSFRLSCVTTGMESAVDPQMQWTVPEQAGSCIVRVFGAPGATFKLVEEW